MVASLGAAAGLLCRWRAAAGPDLDLLDLLGLARLAEGGAAVAVAHDPGDGKIVPLRVAAEMDLHRVADRDPRRYLDVVVEVALVIDPRHRAHRQIALAGRRNRLDVVRRPHGGSEQQQDQDSAS